MAIDKIKPLGLEENIDGTEIFPTPTELDPTEDFVAAKGIALENSDNTTIEGVSGVMKFKDTEVTSQQTLKDAMERLKYKDFDITNLIDNYVVSWNTSGTKFELAGANGVFFDNTSNGFTSIEVQSAIEEAKLYAQGFPRAGIRIVQNGTVGNNDWLGPNELLPNTPAMVVPLHMEINELSWSNQNTNVQFHIEIRTGSKTGTIIYTLTVVSTNPGYGYVDGLTLDLPAGTSVWAQYKDDGTNASDFELTFWVSRIP